VDRPKENIARREVRAPVPHSRHLREAMERPIEVLKDPVGVVEAVV
jgi:hypothetical protein